MSHPVPVEDRFWSRVDRSGGSDACWPWTGGVSSAGYGSLRVNGRNEGAHRVALALSWPGALPEGALACHTCDNRRCCNPTHLYPGTYQTNARDAVERGHRVVTPEWAARIGDAVRRAYADGSRSREVPRKTHCRRGHLLEGDNIRMQTNGARCCRTCAIASHRRSRQRRMVAA